MLNNGEVSEMKLHPTQDMHIDENGTVRFKENKIVSFLLENGGFDMNKLAVMDFSQEDRIQFAQLIGYSFGGFSDLSYVTDASYVEAFQQYEEITKDEQ